MIILSGEKRLLIKKISGFALVAGFIYLVHDIGIEKKKQNFSFVSYGLKQGAKVGFSLSVLHAMRNSPNQSKLRERNVISDEMIKICRMLWN